MKKVALNEKKLMLIKDIGGCSNFGSLVLVGNKMFVIKTKGNNSMSAICEYPNYTQTKRTIHKFEGCMGHGNDIAYYDGKLYIAPCGTYVEVVDTSDWSHYRLSSDLYVSSITHYSGNKFLVLTGYQTYYRISIMQVKDGALKKVSSVNVENPYAKYGYTVTQGIEYKKSSKQVYVVVSKKNLQSNIILRSSVDKENPNACFVSKKSNKGLYEFEGLSFNKSGSMIIGVNLPSSKDAIFKAR